MESGRRNTAMKKFLRLWLRHPVSITLMFVWVCLAIWTRSIIPFIMGLFMSGFLYVIWEVGLASLHIERELWKDLIESEKRKHS